MSLSEPAVRLRRHPLQAADRDRGDAPARHARTDGQWVAHDLRLTQELEGRYPTKVDRTGPVDEDQPVLCLTCMVGRDRDLARVFGARVVIGQTVANPER